MGIAVLLAVGVLVVIAALVAGVLALGVRLARRLEASGEPHEHLQRPRVAAHDARPTR